MTQTGLVSVSFRDRSPEELIWAVKAAGLDCIEWGSDVHAPCEQEDRLRELAALQKEAGIKCCSYGTYFYLGRNKPKELLPYIHAAKCLGTSILRVWCGTKGSAQYSREELEKLYSECKQAAKLAEEHHVILCVECHHGTITDTKESALALMRKVNSKAFQMYWQPNQYCSTEENLEYAAMLAPYTMHIHVFHWCFSESGKLEKLPLSQATALWKAYLSQFSGDRTLLLEFMPDGRLETLAVEAQSLLEMV